MCALESHAAWYIRRFGECKPEWYVFPAGKGQPNDPTRPVTSLKTAWTKVRNKANVVGRWHDKRHTLVTELAESGAGDEVIMSIAGHVSRAMLSRYSHVRMEAKRRALDEIATRQNAADEERRTEAERREAAARFGGNHLASSSRPPSKTAAPTPWEKGLFSSPHQELHQKSQRNDARTQGESKPEGCESSYRSATGQRREESS